MKYFGVIATVMIIAMIGGCVTADAYGDGKDVSCACPRIYDPVCGSDSVTYSNKCMFNCQAKSSKGRNLKLKIVRMGPCDDGEDWF